MKGLAREIVLNKTTGTLTIDGVPIGTFIAAETVTVSVEPEGIDNINVTLFAERIRIEYDKTDPDAPTPIYDALKSA